jgi:hypothetical protein
VLLCHGLGGNKIGKQRLYVTLSEMLAASGIAALRIDFRGSGDSEGSFIDMTVESEVSDALVALQFLKDDPAINSEQIGIFGRSFGGVVALRAASRSSQIKSIALWAPVFSGEQWKEKWLMLQQNKISREQGEELMQIEGMRLGRPFFEQLFGLMLHSELQELRDLPLLHIHGEKDRVVDLSHASDYKKIRREAPGPSEFILLPNSDHDFTHPHERAEAVEKTRKWFQKTLSL